MMPNNNPKSPRHGSDGGFIISEATSISITGRGWLGAPGLYSDEQVEGWKKITAAAQTIRRAKTHDVQTLKVLKHQISHK